MAEAEHYHRMAEQLRLEADRAKAAAHAKQQEAATASQQAALLVQGLRAMERAAEQLDTQLQTVKPGAVGPVHPAAAFGSPAVADDVSPALPHASENQECIATALYVSYTDNATSDLI